MTPSYSLYVTRAIVVLVVLGMATITVLGQQTAARPDRGVMPNGSYAVSDIENISLSNGNVNLRIPLASLPPVAGGKLSWTINAHYNSKIWNVNRVQLLGERYDLELPPVPYVVDTPELSEQGGWRISGQYEIEIRDARSDFDYQLPNVNDEPDYSLMNNYNWHRVVLRMPDGAEHELRPMDYSPFNGGKSFLYGYYKETPYTHGGNMNVRVGAFDGGGRQTLDYADIDKFGKQKGGSTPGSIAIHETTEAYEGITNPKALAAPNPYRDSHAAAIGYENAHRARKGLGARVGESAARSGNDVTVTIDYTTHREHITIDGTNPNQIKSVKVEKKP